MAERPGPNDTLPHGSETARRHHLAHGELLCNQCRTNTAASAARPVVTIQPGMRWGYPTVGAVSTEAVAGMVWAGEPVHVVADEYDLSRPQVLIACWYETTHGQYQQQWAVWLGVAGPALARRNVDWATVPDPPSKERV